MTVMGGLVFVHKKRGIAFQKVACLVGAMFAALHLPQTASAEPAPRYAVKWSTEAGAETCAQEPELTAAIARLVSDQRLVTPEHAERFVDGRVRRSGSWRAELRVRDAAGTILGEREIESGAATCRELDAAVALAIALIVDPEHSGSATPPVPPTEPSLPPPAPAALEVNRAPRARAREPAIILEYRPDPQIRIKADAVVLSGVLPDAAAGAQLELWLPVIGNGSLRLALAYFAPQTRAVPDRPNTNATLYLATARLSYCALLAASPQASVFGCGGLGSGAIVASGQGGGYDRTPVRALFVLDGSLTLEEKLYGPWALSVSSGAGVTPLRAKFSYQTGSGAILVHRQGALEGRLEIGVAYRF